MRKTLLVCAFAALSLGAFAQNTGKDRLTQLENMKLEKKDSVKVKAEKEYNLFDFNGLAHIGYGWYLVTAPEFDKGLRKRNGEFFLNAAEFDICPTRWMSFGLGIDLKWQDFTPSGGNVFTKDEAGNVILAAVPTVDDKRLSTLHCFSLGAPLMLNFDIGPVGLSMGAELVYTPASCVRIKDTYSIGASDYNVTTRECGGVSPISWNAFASLSLGMTGIFFRYYPKQPLVPTAPFNLMTVGIVFRSIDM